MKMTQYFKKSLRLRHPLPYFIIDFNGPKWDFITYDFLKSSFISGEMFIPNCESIHFVSDKDPMANTLRNYLHFEKPTVINHDQGHRPVRTLKKKPLQKVAEFFARQYEKKNGVASENPQVKATLDIFFEGIKTSSMLPFKSNKIQV